MSLFAITEGFNKALKEKGVELTYVVNKKITPKFGAIKEFKIELYTLIDGKAIRPHIDVVIDNRQAISDKSAEENIWTSLEPMFVASMINTFNYDINQPLSDTTD